MYTSYREQYMFGKGVFELKNLDATTPSASYFGTEVGAKTSASACKPIDLKAADQMFVQKARLDIKCLETFAGTAGAVAYLTMYTCGPTSTDPTEANYDVAKVSEAVEVMRIPLSLANKPADSVIPFFEITMPSNLKRFVYIGIILADKTKAFSAGKILVHFNPNN